MIYHVAMVSKYVRSNDTMVLQKKFIGLVNVYQIIVTKCPVVVARTVAAAGG